jgi:hypothetical protein
MGNRICFHFQSVFARVGVRLMCCALWLWEGGWLGHPGARAASKQCCSEFEVAVMTELGLG